MIPTEIQALTRITSFAEARELLLSKDAVIPEMLRGEPTKAQLTGGTLGELDGAPHVEIRRREAALFGAEDLRRLECDMLDASLGDELRRLAKAQGGSGKAAVELLSFMRTVGARITGTLIGLDGLDDTEFSVRLGQLATQMIDGNQLRWKTGNENEGVAKIALDAKASFREEFYRPSAERRRRLVQEHVAGRLERAELPRDLLTMLWIEKPEWSEERRVREAIQYLIAAIDTTGRAVAYSVACLLDWLQSHPEDVARLEDRGFLHAVASEALRIHPTTPGLLRTVTVDLVLSTGRALKAGETVFISLPDANHDESVFGPDAALFNPRRSIPDGARPYGLSFGAGEHICLGRPLVIHPARPASNTSPDSPIGTVARSLLRLLEAGVALDPDNPPRVREGTMKHEFEAYPVILTKLPR